MVRNDSHGPMFKNVIPDDEFASIMAMKSNESVSYTLILVDVYKKALQKVEFTVIKK